jgi:hypothetical protein
MNALFGGNDRYFGDIGGEICGGWSLCVWKIFERRRGNVRLKENIVIAEYADICQAFWISRRTAERLAADGVLAEYKSSAKKKEFDFAASVAAYVRHVQDEAEKKVKPCTREELELEKLRADIALKGTQLELNTIKADIQNGKYILRQDAERDLGKFFLDDVYTS